MTNTQEQESENYIIKGSDGLIYAFFTASTEMEKNNALDHVKDRFKDNGYQEANEIPDELFFELFLTITL